jgi:hypothetical protein
MIFLSNNYPPRGNLIHSDIRFTRLMNFKEFPDLNAKRFHLRCVRAAVRKPVMGYVQLVAANHYTI